MKKLVAFFALLLLLWCTSRPRQNPARTDRSLIRNGKRVGEHQAPWFVHSAVTIWSKNFCSAVLVWYDVVLTAGV